jgi:kynureninase
MHPVAIAQLDAFRNQPHPVSLLDALTGARSPAEISKALTGASRPGFPRMPMVLRQQYREEIGASQADLDLRALYPGLDIGIYACSHSMGVPSLAGPAAVIDQLHQLATMGIEVWESGLWPGVMDQYRRRCAELAGGDLEAGDVCWFPNVSEALCAVLEGFERGSVLYTSGHFTTGHYVHHQWAKNTGGRLIEVPVEPDGSVPTERLIAAMSPETAVISISHALFESGWVQDIGAIAAAARERAPDALILVDAYQTAGTVPLRAREWGDNVAVTAAGHKQLRSSAGAGFLYLPRRWMHLRSKRTGWWQHAAPFSFEKGAVRLADDATRFRTGTPGLTGQAMLLGELAALASSAGGDLGAAVERARGVTSGLVGSSPSTRKKACPSWKLFVKASSA